MPPRPGSSWASSSPSPGFAWDIQWHTDVGPDTFFTAPHLVLYGGVAIAGLTSLAMELLTTWYARRGSPAALERTTAILGGRFRGPLGYVIGGFGAPFFLLFLIRLGLRGWLGVRPGKT